MKRTTFCRVFLLSLWAALLLPRGAMAAPPAKLSKIDGGLAVSLDLPAEQQLLLSLLATADGKAAHAEFAYWSGTKLERASYTLTVVEDKPSPPPSLIEAFTAEPAAIKRGESATLAWSCPRAKTVTINGAAVAPAGKQILTPQTTTTYTLAASDGPKTETAQRTVTVSDTPPPPPPPPAAKWKFVVLVESHTLDNLPQPTKAWLASLVTREKVQKAGHQWIGQYDPDSLSSAAEFKPYLAAAAGKIPCVAAVQLDVAKPDAKDVVIHPLPADEAGLLKLLEGK